MSAIPGDIDADRGPPMTVPLRHFVVALAFLLAGAGFGLLWSLGVAPGLARVAHLHLLLVGWVCVTIMGAMTQFVPVWSGVALHSRRLAVVQLWLVVAGLAGLVAAFLAAGWLFVPAGVALVAGFWTFVYNAGRTLRAAGGWDVTERHFALALGFFALLAPLGFLLAADLRWSVLGAGPVTRDGVVGAHATLAVFGAVLTTVFGALYQLATMFTQTDLRGVDLPVQRFESVAYPAGVVALAAGRLVGVAPLARAGGVLVAASALGVSALLARRLVESRVDWTPMLSRYAVLAGALAVWALLAGATWIAGDPLSRATLLGPSGGAFLLVLGVVGFVVLGTLYHIVPFIVWVHRYSDLLGFEDVPMIDDLYDGRLAAVDFCTFLGGTTLLVAGEVLSLGGSVTLVGSVLLLVGAVVFAANMLLVLRRHGPHSLADVLVGGGSTASAGE